MSDHRNATYTDRAETADNPLARHLFGLMAEKETNLCVAVDETDPVRFLRIAEAVAPHVAVLKTHVDTIEQFTPKLTLELSSLAREHNFLIFEDRKFADIGQTVKNQYTTGAFSIIEWADIVNAHALPGPGIIQGLREAAEAHDMAERRGILLLAQMSSADNLLDADYTKKVVAMAKENADFVTGFIGAGLKALPSLAKQVPPGFIIFTPGAKIGGGGDTLGQRYASPDTLVDAGADVLIVGRGIIQDPKPAVRAKEYRERCWEAYKQRVTEPKVKEKKK
ncbi:MAG: orotidine-5'-phosphate decarboxylase [bacterium]|nr:orotidine-5'-phosphate decarboxylase [bacterium]